MSDVDGIAVGALVVSIAAAAFAGAAALYTARYAKTAEQQLTDSRKPQFRAEWDEYLRTLFVTLLGPQHLDSVEMRVVQSSDGWAAAQFSPHATESDVIAVGRWQIGEQRDFDLEIVPTWGMPEVTTQHLWLRADATSGRNTWMVLLPCDVPLK